MTKAKATTNLIRKDEAHVVVVDFGVHEKSALKIDSAKSMEANSQSRIRVHGLDNFSTLVVDDPIGIDLRISVRIQDNGLVSSEICRVNLGIVRTIVQKVQGSVHVRIVLTDVTFAVSVRVHLLGIVSQPAVVPHVGNAVIVSIRVTLVSNAVLVCVKLVRVRVVDAVIHPVVDTVPVNVVVGVADVAKGVLVVISLIAIGVLGAVVTHVAQTITVLVPLVWVGSLGTVVVFVQDAIVIHVWIACIAQSISIGVLLIQVRQ